MRLWYIINFIGLLLNTQKSKRKISLALLLLRSIRIKIQTILKRLFNSLKWGLNDAPQPLKPHAFTSLPLQSNVLDLMAKLPLGFSTCWIMLTVSACFTVYKLCTSPITGSNNRFLKNLIFLLKNQPLKFLSYLIMIITISYCIRSGVYACLGIDRASVDLYTFIWIIFCTYYS